MKLRLAILCALCALSAATPAAADVLVRGKTIDGPASAIQRLGGFDVARDGTGAAAYVKQDLGVDHVYVARLVAGAWSAPERVDTGLAGASSQPAVAVGDGGLVLVAFVNAGGLVTASRASASSPWSPPATLSPGPVGTGPSLDVSIRGKGYLTFATTGGGSSDVRVASYRSGAWTLVATPLDADPSADAGAGAGRPRVVAAATGVAVVAWGEEGQIYARRVRDAQPSTSVARADVPSLGGQPSQGADSPEVGSIFDDTYAQVAFRQDFAVSGGGTISRVLQRPLRGSQFDSANPADGAPTAVDGAVAPRLAVDGRGYELLVSARQSSHRVFAQGRRGDPALRVDSDASTAEPSPVTALSGVRGVIAWAHDDGVAPAEIVARRATLLSNAQLLAPGLAPEQPLSEPASGPALAGLGLEAAGDRQGDLFAAFVQGLGDPGDARRISVSYYDAPPAPFSVSFTDHFQPRARPLLTWRPSADLLDPVRYEVSVDGGAPFSTSGLSARPAALADGAHGLDVTAIDSLGQRTAAAHRALRVDTRKPRARLGIRGVRRAGRTLRLTVAASDPPRQRGISTSGVGRIIVSFGDGSRRRAIRRSILHSFARPGRYRLVVTVADRAGNLVRYRPVVRIARRG